MKKIFLAFVDFVKKPDDTQHPDQRVQSKWRVFSVLFFLELLLLAVYLPVLTFLERYMQLEEAFDMTFSAVVTFFIMVLIVPLIEEFVFRLILRRNALTKPFFSERRWRQFFPYLVYTSVILFGLVHITNFANDNWLFYVLAPVVVLTQLVGGMVISYLRVRFNFWLGFLYHASWNFMAIFVLGGIFYVFTTEEFHHKTADYELTMQERMFEPLFATQVMSLEGGDEVTIYEFRTNGFNVGKMLQHLSPDNQKYKAVPSTVLSVDLTAKNGVPADTLLYWLEKEKFIIRQEN